MQSTSFPLAGSINRGSSQDRCSAIISGVKFGKKSCTGKKGASCSTMRCMVVSPILIGCAVAASGMIDVLPRSGPVWFGDYPAFPGGDRRRIPLGAGEAGWPFADEGLAALHPIRAGVYDVDLSPGNACDLCWT